MAKAYFILALVLQASIIYATDSDENENDLASREILKTKPDVEEEFGAFKGQKDWMEMFFMPIPNSMFPSSSAALMSSVTNSDKTAEEQLEDIKEMANKITLAIQSEMANLLSYALAHCDKDGEGEKNENSLRRKRETPMDSSQLIMRLLKHIKSNNEYQNIAIEKMMSAQEIADKFGIEFTPDPDVLSDLAIAANEQAKEMTSILKDACDMKNATKNKEDVKFVPVEKCEQTQKENNTYYVYSVHQPDQEMFVQQPFPTHEYPPEHYARSPAMNHGHHDHHNNHHQFENHAPHHVPSPIYEHQMPHQIPPPVTPKPNFYDSMMAYTPDYSYTCPMEPVTTTTTIVLPIEEFVEPEPELVGEEYEETVSSKMYVTRDEEPGSATVNHVMTYTMSEKAHFKKPEIEKLPQQMQYTFFLM